MRILLVNAYAKTPAGSRRYADFRDYLLKVTNEQDENLEGKNLTLIERDKNEIDEFLFDLNTSYSRKDAANNFDILDLVCVIGDVNLLPWQKPAEKAVILIKMCLRVKKWLFAVGFGMNALIYLSASNLEKPIRVINGNGRGGKLGDLTELNVTTIEISPSDYFLDHVTGDLYSYNHELEEWTPSTNIGLHYQRAAHEYNTIGKYVVKAPVYHAKTINGGGQFNFTEGTETLCMLKKHEYSHWLFEDVTPEFVVAWKTHWEVHSFGFPDPSKVFSILAESKVGPMIIQYLHIIGVQFDIQKRYPDTLKILKNFLMVKLRKLVSDEPGQLISIYRYKELDTKNYTLFGYVFKKNGDQKEIKPTTNGFKSTRGVKNIDESSQQDAKRLTTQSFSTANRPMSSMEAVPQKFFAHSGYASKNKGPQIVEQNVIANLKIQGAKKGKKDVSFHDRLQDLRDKFKENFFTERAEEPLALVETPVAHKEKTEIRRPISLETPKHGSININKLISPQNKAQTASSNNKLLEQVFSKAEVRKLIYPQLKDEYLGERTSWVPGNLSKHKKETHKPVIKIDSGLQTTRSLFMKRTKLKGLEVPDDFGFRTIRIETPYVSAEEARRRDQKESDKKILAGKFFRVPSKLSSSRLFKQLPDTPNVDNRRLIVSRSQERKQN